MKSSIILAFASLLLIFPTLSVRCQNTSTNLVQDGIFIVSARGGIIEVANDRVEIPIMPFDSETLSQEKINALKDAWKQCYGAILLNKKDSLDSFFSKGVPNVLQVIDYNEGQVKIVMTSRVKNTIRIILRIEVFQSSNVVTTIHDAHTWRMNDKGEWEVESTIYQ